MILKVSAITSSPVTVCIAQVCTSCQTMPASLSTSVTDVYVSVSPCETPADIGWAHVYCHLPLQACKEGLSAAAGEPSSGLVQGCCDALALGRGLVLLRCLNWAGAGGLWELCSSVRRDVPGAEEAAGAAGSSPWSGGELWP